MGPHVVPYLRFEQRDPDTFEIVVLDGWKGKVISNRPDGSYAVSDLFARHPSRQGSSMLSRKRLLDLTSLSQVFGASLDESMIRLFW